VPQLAHSGVDDGKSCSAALPGAEVVSVTIPGEVGEVVAEGLVGSAREMKKEVVRKLTPAELPQEASPGFRANTLLLEDR
jgi:hypothetical protein